MISGRQQVYRYNDHRMPLAPSGACGAFGAVDRSATGFRGVEHYPISHLLRDRARLGATDKVCQRIQTGPSQAGNR